MKDTKFKLFHKPSKKMYIFDPRWGNFRQGGGWVGGVPLDDFERNGRTFAPSNQEQLEPESCEWMKFAGLLDKDNKEICEGDICEKDGERGVIFWNNELALFSIDRRYPCNKTPLVYVEFLIDFTSESRIVGNIYENPELLGGR